MAKKEKTLHDFLIQKIRSASQKWPETYKIKERVRVEVVVKYDPNNPDELIIMVPETKCTLANGTEYIVPIQTIIKKIYKPAKNGKRVMYLCEDCKQLFFEKDWVMNKKGELLHKVMIASDHLLPVVCPRTGFVDWNTYFERMFPGPSGLQILCNFPGEINGKISCHRKKTTIEKGIAAERERQKKNKSQKGANK